MKKTDPHDPGPRRQRLRASARGVLAEGRESWDELVGGHTLTRWWPDVLLVLALSFWNTVGSLGAGTGLWLVGMVQIVPLLWRRRAPLLAAGAVAIGCLIQLAASDNPHAANIAVPIAVYSAAAFGTRTASRAVLGLGLIGSVLAGLDWSWGLYSTGTILSALVPMAFITFFLAMFVTVAWVLGDMVRRRKAVVSQLKEQNRALARDHAQRTKLAAQDERASIAREMHDVVAHSLAVVVVQADGALYAARTALDQPPAIGPDREALERAASTLDTLAQTARSSLAETRKLVGVLREEGAGAEYSPLRGLTHLEELVQGVRESGLTIHLAVRGRIDDLAKDVDLAAYRVVQESLTNALKHAGPDAIVDVDVLRTPAVLLVRVTDDGLGLSPDADGEGNGILGMAERVEVLGGAVQAGPRPRGGWEVVATIPTDHGDSIDQENPADPDRIPASQGDPAGPDRIPSSTGHTTTGPATPGPTTTGPTSTGPTTTGPTTPGPTNGPTTTGDQR